MSLKESASAVFCELITNHKPRNTILGLSFLIIFTDSAIVIICKRQIYHLGTLQLVTLTIQTTYKYFYNQVSLQANSRRLGLTIS